MDKISTRGFIGIRNNNRLVEGYFNHWDSYYDALGKEVIDLYFDDNGNSLEDIKDLQVDKEFLQDGLFCEYAYIYNQEDNKLEIYRGFFKKKQIFNNIKANILNALESKGEEDFCHLIMIIDKKKHTKKQVLKAFKEYEDRSDDENEYEEINPYPERKIIPLELPKNYFQLV